MIKILTVTTWTNGTSIYGIRISKKDTNLFKEFDSVTIEIDNEIVEIKKTEGFHKDCPELRHPKIKVFFEKNNLIKWEKRKPHKLKLIQDKFNKFKLRTITKDFNEL